MSSGEFFERKVRLRDGRVVTEPIEARRWVVNCINVGRGCRSRGRASALASKEDVAHRLIRRTGWRISPDGRKATCPACMEAYGGKKP